ncbi:ABC transporter permease [Sphingobium nicotianae]|uniref:ABC transporter permease n=1 Tax=Sphingobium nicotianae TaxID=2782607 RepID=A0A9X1IQK9_9SPHN|nr:ABC transporter permease [Sphingobium nicotianae]MBT2186719.1 ABC transporter permease [Sphingobium nicotianae]
MTEGMNEIVRGALVIARRDFNALIRSRAFIFFLITPVIMLGIALAAGNVGSHMAKPDLARTIAVAMPDGDVARLIAAQRRLKAIVPDFPMLETGRAESASGDLLLAGSLRSPVLHADAQDAQALGDEVRLLVDTARQSEDAVAAPLAIRLKPARPHPAAPVDRSATAQLGQMCLFLATMLLAGMVLSNLVEEKANKIIEILTASIPMEAIFLGKLFAMLGMALIAIAVWTALGGAIALLAGSALPAVPAPAVGWPLFVALGFVYFSSAYLLLGSLYLGIGAMAATVRDVQTLSMPVSMGQVGIFLFANYATARPGTLIEGVACLFPFSSPFALMARAAQFPALWPHLVLLLWQALCTWLIIRAGTAMFRRNVMKSRGMGRRAGGRRGRVQPS